MKTPVTHGRRHCWIGVLMLVLILCFVAVLYKRNADAEGRAPYSPVSEVVRGIRRSVAEKKLMRAGNPYVFRGGEENVRTCAAPDSWARYAVLK